MLFLRGLEFYYQLLSIRQIKLGNNLPSLENPTLGWIGAGVITGGGIGSKKEDLSNEWIIFEVWATFPSTSVKYLRPIEK